MRALLPLFMLTAYTVGLFAVASLVYAAPACANCPPTTVQGNADGSVTVSTTAVPKSECFGSTSPTKGACNLRFGAGVWPTDGGPVTLFPTGCPCQGQFWVHAGQWHPYSALSPVWP